MRRSLAGELLLRYGAISAASFIALFLFVFFDADNYFDSRYQQFGLTGLGYEIADHVLLPFAVLLLPLLLATPWIVSQSLKPLARAARLIDEASGKERGFRVEVSELPQEAAPFAIALNGLLHRLDEVAEQHEAFAADIAHELRTPLAVLRLEVEHLEDPLARNLKDELARMARLVEQLLLLAQLDVDATSAAPRDQVPLADVAAEVVGRAAPIAIAQGRTIELKCLQRPVIAGRRETIAAGLRNLIENALRVTPEGEAVTVIVGQGARLRVRDRGPGLSAARLEDLQRRLSRAEHASSDGAGLGLAIVSKVMSGHGGQLHTDPGRRELIMLFPHQDRQHET